MLVECDPAIKSIIVNIDSQNHDFIIEDLDEQRLVIKENMMEALKIKLEDVRYNPPPISIIALLTVAYSASRKPHNRKTRNQIRTERSVRRNIVAPAIPQMHKKCIYLNLLVRE